jgi:hypothetical protein
MESDDLDEVDWEFLGGDTTQTQTNYFGKGDTTTYDRAIFYPVSSPQTTQHSYAVNWTSSSLEWLIDGVVVRTLNYNDAEGGTRFPQTPMRLKVGIWAGGDPSNGPGTIEWAGGPTVYSAGPFTMTVQSVNIVNYSPGSSYTWSDESGSWESIKVSGGSGIAGNSGSSGNSPSSSDPQATTSVASGSSAIHVSTAASSVSSSTGGGSIVSSAPAVILQSTLSSHSATPTTNATTSGVSPTQTPAASESSTLRAPPSHSSPTSTPVSAANATVTGTTLATGSRTASASSSSSTSASGADKVRSRTSFAALFAVALVAAHL